MGGPRLAVTVVLAALISSACGERQSDSPTAPDLARSGGGCNFTTVSSLTKDEFGANSTESGLATNMKNAGAGTAQATSLGFQILAAIADKYDGTQTSTTNASALTVALLGCMDLGGASVPAASVFDLPLGAHGAYGVVTAGDVGPVTSHDGQWLLEPPGTAQWGAIFPAGVSALLVYGNPVTIQNFSNDDQLSTIFDWKTLPTVTFAEPGVVIGNCSAPSQYLQHNAVGSGAEVLGFIRPSCFNPTALLTEPTPANWGDRLFRFLAPAPAYAALTVTTGSAGSKRTLSPYQVIGPDSVELSAQFTWKKSGNTVGLTFENVQIPTYQIKSQGGTNWLQDYVLIFLEAIGNQGAKVDMCNNYAYTNANGIAQFPKGYFNKSGGYTVVARTTGTVSKPGVTGTDIPSVPPGRSVPSPLVNVKNGNPGTCFSFHEGDTFPEAPGPNGFAPVP